MRRNLTDIPNNLASNLAAIKGATVVRSFCYSCPWTCPTEVYVKDDKVVYVKGNENSPNSAGKRCGKGMASSYVTTDPDRLKYPMRRTGPKGSGQFDRISWDEAFSLIAENLTSIRDRYGPEAVVYLYHHDPNSVFARNLLTKLYGSPNFYGHTSGCEQDRRTAAITLFGNLFPTHDFLNSRYVMLWGINMFGANEGVSEPRALMEAREKGCKVVMLK